MERVADQPPERQPGAAGEEPGAALAGNWTVDGGPTGNRRIGMQTKTAGWAAMLGALRLVLRVLT
ncbi:MAG: hypothetical protein ACRD1K_10935 [Acidimicrobiales bacterium]